MSDFKYEPEIKILSQYSHKEPRVYAHHQIYKGMKADATLSMLDRWGMVTATPDGEDSAGRQQLKVMPVNEMVSRAIETVDAAFNEFEKRGWVTKVPSLDKMYKIIEGDENE